MTAKDPLEVLLTRELAIDDYRARKAAASRRTARFPRVITLSRDYGALGEEIAQALGERLSLPVYGDEILERVAERACTDKFYLQHLDEKGSAAVTTFLYSLLSGSTATLQSYRRCLYDVILELATQDCLLIGRGAHLILQDHPVFRLRIVGSRWVCAERISREQGIPLPEAAEKVAEINGKRHKSILNLFAETHEHASLEYAANFDLVLNTDHFSVEAAVKVVLLALAEVEAARQVPASSL